MNDALPHADSSEADVPGVIAPPPLIFVTAWMSSTLLSELLGGPLLPARPTRLAGALLAGAGLALAAAGAVTQRRAGTDFVPYNPSTALVESGVYARTRNPMYLGMALAYAGFALVRRTPITLAGLPLALVLIARGVIDREERYLRRKFGEPYAAYMQRVRRWF